MISKILDFLKTWSKILIGLLAVVFFFIFMKKLGISLPGFLILIKNFVKPSVSSKDAESATKISESKTVEEVKIDGTQAQKVSDKSINEIDRILNEIANSK